ncbi:pilus assembly protein TadG-related protein [Rhodosalinus sp. 5P4]|uniref:pilus assembly protein TadG-related protein n=1 Tax=Rhodosalinus sp. 5P4 TaxID=3239196 RepID=UPI003523F46F
MKAPRHHLEAFARDEHGGVIILAAVSMAVMLGMAALVFDMGRLATTQTELQSFADNVALAAAGELDGEPDAIARANAATGSLVEGGQTFAEGAQALTGAVDATVVYLSGLPANDRDPVTGFVTTDPADAIYAHVTIRPRQVHLPFARAFAALTGNTPVGEDVGAEAVAGFTRYACDITPMMLCVPPGFEASAARGTMIRLRAGQGGTSWGPGNFGFLNPSTGLQADPAGPCAGVNGQPLEACLLAAARLRSQCFVQRGVDTSPGQSQGNMAAGLNVRFDLYSGTMNNRRSDPDFGPAPNVMDGNTVGGNCRAEDSPISIGLPRDACLDAGTCAPDVRIGDGVFSMSDYIATNYGGTAPAWLPAAPATRYEVYLAEIANAAEARALLSEPADFEASCGRPSADPERRVIIAAGIDCTANPVAGNARNVPVKEFVRLFLTEPGEPSTQDVFAEVLGSAEGQGEGGVIHDIVQLYR